MALKSLQQSNNLVFEALRGFPREVQVAEYVAERLGIAVGVRRQRSGNMLVPKILANGLNLFSGLAASQCQAHGQVP